MNDKFFDLKQEKQDRIINGALKIFAHNSYRHSSTDDIVREAGISKGLLFHYFTSKLGLYSFLYGYSVRFMTLELSRKVDKSETDFFELIKQMEAAKIQVMKMYPHMQQFLNTAARETGTDAAEEIEDRRNEFTELTRSYMAQADYSVFQEIGDSERIIRLVNYTIAGLTEDLSARYDFTPEKLYHETCVYLEMLHKMSRR